METKACPHCGGTGAILQPVTAAGRNFMMPKLCRQCEGSGEIMETEHNAENVMESVPPPDEGGYWTRTAAGGLAYHVNRETSESD